MWRWNLFVIFIVFFKHNSSQPIVVADNGNRPARQLDFVECCPCPDKNVEDIHFDDELKDSMDDSTETILSSAHDLENCPCRLRDSDPQAASSMLFPTAIRSVGNLVRSNSDKDTLKPLFNPEVDLASSVLETLKEATDEEYEDALARDAAKSALRAVDDFVFGDATPQESANIVAIVVKPKDTDDNDDVLPDASHVQQSRCIHPIESSKGNLGTTVGAKTGLTSQIPRLSKIRPELLHRNFNDIDSDVDATNINKERIPVILNAEDIEVEPSKFKVSTIDRDTDENFSLGKVPDFRLAHIQNKLKGLSRSSLLQNIGNKIDNSLKITSKVKETNWIPESATNYKADFNPASSDNHELLETMVPHFRSNSFWPNGKEKNSPLSLNNLLNLRDVEIIPLKELVSKQVENVRKNKPKSLLYSLLNQHNVQDTQKYNDSTIKTFDLKESSSFLNEQVTSNEEQLVEDNLHSNIDTKNTAMRISDMVARKHNIQTIDKDCIQDENDTSDNFIANGMIGRNDIIESSEEVQTITENVNFESVESCDIKEKNQKSTEIHDTKLKREFAGISIDKTVSNIKENIAKQLNNLKHIGTSTKNKNIRDKEAYDSDLVNNPNPISRNIDLIEENWNETFMESTTINSDDLKNKLEMVSIPPKLIRCDDNMEGRVIKFNSNINNDNVGASNEYYAASEMRLHELQKLSDSLLQQEEREQELQSKNVINKGKFENSENVEKNENTVDLSEFIDKPVEIVEDSSNEETSTRIYNELFDSINDLQEINLKEEQCAVDSDGRASEIVMNIVPESNDIMGVPRPKHNFLKMPLSNLDDVLSIPTFKTLPIFDDIKLKMANLFDRDVRRPDLDMVGMHVEKVRKTNEPDNLKGNIEENNYKGESMELKFDLIDTKSIYNDMNINDASKDNVAFDSQFMNPLQPSYLKESQPSDLNDILNIPALDTHNENKFKLIHDEDNQGINWLNVRTCDNDNKQEVDATETTIIDKMNDVHDLKNHIVAFPSPSAIYKNVDDDTIIISKKDDRILQPQLSFLNNSFQNFDNILNIPNSKPLEMFDDIKERFANLFDKKNRNTNDTKVDLSKTNHMQDKNIVENEKFNNIKGNAEDGNCKSDLVIPRNPTSDVIDGNVEASNMALHVMPKNNKNFSVQPAVQPKLNLLKASSSIPAAISNIPVLRPLSTLDNEKGNSNIVCHIDEKYIEDPKILVSLPMPKTLDFLNPDMATDASTSSSQSRVHSLILVDDGSLQLHTGNKNLPSTLTNPSDIKPTRVHVKEQYLDSPMQATNKIYSTLRSPSNPLEARFNQLANNKFNILKRPITRSSSILDTISQNHEEFNDKMKALHIDFNDRIESIRNGLIDRSKLLTGSRNIKPQFKFPNNLFKQNKVKQSVKKTSSAPDSRQSLKSIVPRKPIESKSIKTISLPKTESKKLRMPTAASIPVPKTVRVPELKTIPTKLSPLSLQKSPLKTQNWKTEVPHRKENFESFGRQPTNSKLSNISPQEKNNANKKSKIKVSFSTTIRPTISTENSIKNSPLQWKDFNRLPAHKLITDRENTFKSLPLETPFKKISDIKSWPRATERSFLSKVRDAVQARLFMKSPITLKQPQLQNDDSNSSRESIFSTDMTRAASNGKSIVDDSLKENVSYKCKLICGKE